MAALNNPPSSLKDY